MVEVTNEEVERYHRQLLLSEVGLEGQAKLKASKVLVVGAGGLGSPILLYLAGAGIGTLGVIDGDSVEVINLHRQIIHTSSNTRVNKAESAKQAILALNPLVNVEIYTEWLTSKSSELIVPRYDVLVIATDNPESRYLISDLGVFYKKPVVSGSCVRWDGQLTVFFKGPCLRCIFPVPTPRKALTRAADVGVLGPIPGIMGTLQAIEVIKFVLGIEVMVGKMLVYDGLLTRFRVFNTRGKVAECPACNGQINPHEFDYPGFITQVPPVRVNVERSVSCEGLKELISTDRVEVIDLRPANQFVISHIKNSKNVPAHEIHKLDIYSSPNPLVFVDRNGSVAVDIVETMYDKGIECSYLLGGLDAWSKANPDFLLF